MYTHAHTHTHTNTHMHTYTPHTCALTINAHPSVLSGGYGVKRDIKERGRHRIGMRARESDGEQERARESKSSEVTGGRSKRLGRYVYRERTGCEVPGWIW